MTSKIPGGAILGDPSSSNTSTKRPTSSSGGAVEDAPSLPYRDFSRLTAAMDAAEAESKRIADAMRGLAPAAKGADGADKMTTLVLGRKSVSTDRCFPNILHYVLSINSNGTDEDDDVSHIISWQPHGRSFRVHQPVAFVEQVLGRYFRQTKYASFQRQLNLYGFHRISSGPDKHSYYHEYFLRGKSFLTRHIPRVATKGIGTRRSASAILEPDFSSMPVLPPTSSSGDNIINTNSEAERRFSTSSTSTSSTRASILSNIPPDRRRLSALPIHTGVTMHTTPPLTVEEAYVFAVRQQLQQQQFQILQQQRFQQQRLQQQQQRREQLSALLHCPTLLSEEVLMEALLLRRTSASSAAPQTAMPPHAPWNNHNAGYHRLLNREVPQLGLQSNLPTVSLPPQASVYTKHNKPGRTVRIGTAEYRNVKDITFP